MKKAEWNRLRSQRRKRYSFVAERDGSRMSRILVNGKHIAHSHGKSLTACRSFRACSSSARHSAFFIFLNRASVNVWCEPSKPQKARNSWRLRGGEVVALSKRRSANHHVNSDSENCRVFYGRASRDFAIKNTSFFGAGYASR